MNIRSRLLSYYLVAMALILLAFSAVLYWRTRRQLTAGIDTYLDERINLLVAQMELTEDEISLNLTLVGPDPNLLWQVGTPKGRVLHRSGAHRDAVVSITGRQALETGKTEFWTLVREDGEPLRLAARRSLLGRPRRLIRIEWRDPTDRAEVTEIPPERDEDAPAFIVCAGKSLAFRNAALRRLLLALVIAVPGALAILAIGGFLLVARPLALVDAITRTAAGIEPERLSARVPVGDTADEISRLAEVMNSMLDRIAKGYEHERQFASDASHELRTPLTALRGEMEVVLCKVRAPEDYREVLEHGLQDVERMGRIVEGLLFLARADEGRVKQEATKVELAGILTRATGLARRSPHAPDVHFPVLVGGPMPVSGNRELLERLFANLLENAVKHGGPPVRLVAEDTDSSWAIVVADSGPGIPEEHLSHVFDRFYRVDKARSRATGGAGLGLAICRWITESHGGTISARNDPEGGAVFTVTLPKSRS